MIYNLAAVFDGKLHGELLTFAEALQSKNECEFEYTESSIPHATLIKCESEFNPFTSVDSQSFSVTLSGLTLLPSRSNEDGGLWVEVSVLIPEALRSLVSDLAKGLSPGTIKSEVGDELRPHLTVCKLHSWKDVKLGDLDPALFRKSDVKIELRVGVSGKGFSFDYI